MRPWSLSVSSTRVTLRILLLTTPAAIHGTHMVHAYDFYKPKLDSEYPEVDGPLSITSYVSAVDASYAAFCKKYAKAKKVASLNGNGIANGGAPAFSLANVDYPVFHSPYGKMVQKAHARLVWNDFMSNPSHPRFANVPNPGAILAQPYKESLLDKTLEKTFMSVAKAEFESSVELSMKCARRCGNMYTASLYGGLASLVSSIEPQEFLGKRISMFAYGSGIASSFFVIKVKGDTSEIKKNLDLVNRLAAMKVVPCQEYVDSLKVRLSRSIFYPTADPSSAAAGGAPPHQDMDPQGFCRQHLARRLLPRGGRRQVPPQVRSCAQGISSVFPRSPSLWLCYIPFICFHAILPPYAACSWGGCWMIMC